MKAGTTLELLRNEVIRQNSAKDDFIVNPSRLQMDAYGQTVALRMLDDNGFDHTEPMDIGTVAHRQFGVYTGIPSKYYGRMLETAPELLAQNVNHWLQRETSPRMLRTMDGTARALLSDRYRRIDNFEILQAVLPVIGEIPDVRVESCEITEERMYLKFTNPRLEREVRQGDIVQAGIVISNSELGLGAVSILPMVLRLVCMNGMTVNDARTRRNHIGRINNADENYRLYSDETLIAEDRAFLMKIQDTVRAAVDEAIFDRVVDMMRTAAGARMISDVPGIVKLAAKDYYIAENEETGVLNHLIQGGDLTLYGLSNAITRYSQDVESYDRASELEGIGFDVLSMPMQRWNTMNQSAAEYAAAA